MMTTRPLDSASDGYSIGSEPLPGYRLVRPLGRGGFGEVWECLAPGGLAKAIKFVTANQSDFELDSNASDALFQQEYKSLQQVKDARHPFLVNLERVELIGQTLIMVMELADRNLDDRYQECKAAGLPGIPRQELLTYLFDAAEALDEMAAKYNLQHLDIKPANVFVFGRHAKVGDFGLVSRIDPTGVPSNDPAGGTGLTPKYCPPERFQGQVHARSDQYSLALVYTEMLTGRFPFPAKSAKQLMLMHCATPPDLSGLSDSDQLALARALAKNPDDRFPNCQAMTQALGAVDTGSGIQGLSAPAQLPTVPSPGPAQPPSPAPTKPKSSTPALVTVRDIHRPDVKVSAGVETTITNQGRIAVQDAPRQSKPDDATVELVELVSAPRPPDSRIGQLVVPVEALRAGNPSLDSKQEVAPPTAEGYGFMLFESINGIVGIDAQAITSRTPIRRADGTWGCEFPAKPLAATLDLKLQAVRDHWGGRLRRMVPSVAVYQIAAGSSHSGRPKDQGFVGAEIEIHLPVGGGQADVVKLVGRAVGSDDPVFSSAMDDLLPKVMTDIRGQLQNREEKYAPRLSYGGPLVFHPLTRAGYLLTPVPGRAVDISRSGFSAVMTGAFPDHPAYVVFPHLGPVERWAVLIDLVRREPAAGGTEIGARFRTKGIKTK